MPKSKELTIRMEDEPGKLGHCCRALADHGVNILAFQAFEHEREGVARLLVDNSQEAKKALDERGIRYMEQEVALTTMPSRPGELSRASSKLGGAKINITHAYCGLDPSSNQPLLIFGVDDVAKAVALLDKLAKEETKAA